MLLSFNAVLFHDLNITTQLSSWAKAPLDFFRFVSVIFGDNVAVFSCETLLSMLSCIFIYEGKQAYSVLVLWERLMIEPM